MMYLHVHQYGRRQLAKGGAGGLTFALGPADVACHNGLLSTGSPLKKVATIIAEKQ